MAAAHASVVPNPRSTEPPNASSKPASVVPASRESKSSIAGTAIDASSIVAPAKSGALRQLGAGDDASVPWAAASKQSRRPRSATSTGDHGGERGDQPARAVTGNVVVAGVRDQIVGNDVNRTVRHHGRGRGSGDHQCDQRAGNDGH